MRFVRGSGKRFAGANLVFLLRVVGAAASFALGGFPGWRPGFRGGLLRCSLAV